MKQEDLEHALASVYAKDYLPDTESHTAGYIIGILCDQYLDRSGALLGRVIDKASKIHRQNLIKIKEEEIKRLRQEIIQLQGNN